MFGMREQPDNTPGKTARTADDSTSIDLTSITSVLFDKDGTLIDFNRSWLERYREAAQVLVQHTASDAGVDDLLAAGGYVAEHDHWRADSVLASGSNLQILEFWEAQLRTPLTDEIKSRYTAILSAPPASHAVVLDDLPGYCLTLTQRGYQLGVATMDDEADARMMLQQTDCLDVMSFVCGADSGFGLKPDPGMVEAFARHLELPVSSVMMVGDSPRDLKMGRAAGAGATVGVLTGASARIDLEPWADLICDDIGQLLALLPGQAATG